MSTVGEVVVGGDPGSCSRLGAVLRQESSHLAERRVALAAAVQELAGWTGAAADAARVVLAAQLAVLAECADTLDRAGAAVQHFATELAQARALSHRAEQSAHAAGLLILDGRVREPWGVASSADAARRIGLTPQVQALVDAAEDTAERARAGLRREALELSRVLARQSRQVRGTPSR